MGHISGLCLLISYIAEIIQRGKNIKMCSKLAALILAIACAAFAVDQRIHESCFLAIQFVDGNTASRHSCFCC